jgi:hypothetical protein
MWHDEVTNTKGLVQRFGLSESYWNKARVSGNSPPYLKCGRRVLYRISDVETWLESAPARPTLAEIPARAPLRKRY